MMLVTRLCVGPSRDLDCPAGTLVTIRQGSHQRARCPSCAAVKANADRPATRARDRAHKARRPDLYDAAETRRRALVVAAAAGWCAGDGPGHPPHPSGDLTAHHVDGPGKGPLKAICRSLNSSIGSPNRP